MTPEFEKVIKRYMKKYGVGFRDAASILGNRPKKNRKKDVIVKPLKLKQSELDFGDDSPKYGHVDV